ncbi:hypothetical protein [Streptomyces sp. S1]|uniref:hypothetical protein n=1 Tax=Streptomyces sp. S1 TaxID=718288 RepID=UPI003D74C16F
MSDIEDPDGDLRVTPPKTWATGLPAVTHALGQTSPRRTALTLLNINQAKGSDCPASKGVVIRLEPADAPVRPA